MGPVWLDVHAEQLDNEEKKSWPTRVLAASFYLRATITIQSSFVH
jgi:hypothetical protein